MHGPQQWMNILTTFSDQWYNTIIVILWSLTILDGMQYIPFYLLISVILTSHDIESYTIFFFLLKSILATIFTSVADGIRSVFIHDSVCYCWCIHCVFSRFPAFHLYKLVQVTSAHSFVWTIVIALGRMCCSKYCLIMLCDFAWSHDL